MTTKYWGGWRKSLALCLLRGADPLVFAQVTRSWVWTGAVCRDSATRRQLQSSGTDAAILLFSFQIIFYTLSTCNLYLSKFLVHQQIPSTNTNIDKIKLNSCFSQRFSFSSFTSILVLLRGSSFPLLHFLHPFFLRWCSILFVYYHPLLFFSDFLPFLLIFYCIILFSFSDDLPFCLSTIILYFSSQRFSLSYWFSMILYSFSSFLKYSTILSSKNDIPFYPADFIHSLGLSSFQCSLQSFFFLNIPAFPCHPYGYPSASKIQIYIFKLFFKKVLWREKNWRVIFCRNIRSGPVLIHLTRRLLARR